MQLRIWDDDVLSWNWDIFLKSPSPHHSTLKQRAALMHTNSNSWILPTKKNKYRKWSHHLARSHVDMTSDVNGYGHKCLHLMDSVNKGMKSSDHPAEAAVTFIMTTVIALQLWMALPHGAPWRIRVVHNKYRWQVWWKTVRADVWSLWVVQMFLQINQATVDIIYYRCAGCSGPDLQSVLQTEVTRLFRIHSQSLKEPHHEHNGSQPLHSHMPAKVTSVHGSNKRKWTQEEIVEHTEHMLPLSSRLQLIFFCFMTLDWVENMNYAVWFLCARN